MKIKIIRAFFAVYLALSMVYSGVRAAYLTVMAAMEPPDRAEEQIELAAPASFGVDTVPAEPKLPEVVVPSPEILPEDTPAPDSEAVLEPSPEVTTAPSPEMAAEAEEDAEPEEESEAAEEIPGEPEEAGDDAIEAEPETPAEEVPAEALIEPPEAEPDQETASIEAAPAQDIPSLEDYLSTLHCGRCGRNCFLSNPHCRTGRSKAQSAAEDYYAEYGVSEDI